MPVELPKLARLLTAATKKTNPCCLSVLASMASAIRCSTVPGPRWNTGRAGLGAFSPKWVPPPLTRSWPKSWWTYSVMKPGESNYMVHYCQCWWSCSLLHHTLFKTVQFSDICSWWQLYFTLSCVPTNCFCLCMRILEETFLAHLCTITEEECYKEAKKVFWTYCPVDR